MKKQSHHHLIDIFKMVGVVLFIAVPTNIFASFNPTLNFIFVGILGRLFIPFLFITSSYYLFSSLDLVRNLHDTYNLNKIKKYLMYLLRIYVVWSIIYFIPVVIHWINDGFSLLSIIYYIRDFIFVGSYYHLWIFPALVFGIIFTYYLLGKFAAWDVFKIAAGLYLVGMLLNIYYPVLHSIPGLRILVEGYKLVFKTSTNGLFFAPIYVLLGYYCATNSFNMNTVDISKRLSISFVFVVLEALLIRTFKLDSSTTIMYVSLIPLTFYTLILAIRVPINEHGRFYTFRSLTTLMYVSHVVFILLLRALPVGTYNSLLFYILTLLLTLYFSDLIYLGTKKFFPKLKILY